MILGRESRWRRLEWACRVPSHTSSFRGWHPRRFRCKGSPRSVHSTRRRQHLEWHIFIASQDLKDSARAWIDKLSVKNGAYPPDSYPNPGESIALLFILPLWPQSYLKILSRNSACISQCTTGSKRISGTIWSRFIRRPNNTERWNDTQGAVHFSRRQDSWQLILLRLWRSAQANWWWPGRMHSSRINQLTLSLLRQLLLEPNARQ